MLQAMLCMEKLAHFHVGYGLIVESVDYNRRIIEGQAPPLVVDALNVSQQTHGRRSWWNQLKNILSTFNLAPDGILLSKSECILKLQEDFTTVVRHKKDGWKQAEIIQRV